MLARITGILGVFPVKVLLRGKESHKYFTLANVVYERPDTTTTGSSSSSDPPIVLIYPKKTTLACRLHMDSTSRLEEDSPINDDEAHLFIDFITSLLHLDPLLRPTATQALKHPWLNGCDEFDLLALNAAEDRWGSGKSSMPPPPPDEDQYEDQYEEDV